MRAEIRGRDLVSGLPKTIVIGSEEIRGALDETVGHIVEAVKDTLDRTPPEPLVTSWIAESPSPAAAPSCKDSNSAFATSARCRVSWQSHRLRAWRCGSGISLEEFEAIHRASKRNSGTRHVCLAPLHLNSPT